MQRASNPKENYILLIAQSNFSNAKQWQNLTYEIISTATLVQAREQMFKAPPIAILLSTESDNWQELLLQLKNDLVFKHLPTILILDQSHSINLHSLYKLPFDDWVDSQCRSSELELRIHKCHNQMSNYLDASPLTHLPGNSSIMQKIKECLNSEEEFAIVYLDIDNFKAFNDYYGFIRGDDLIRMTARLLVNEVSRNSKKIQFTGHIGGDDFVFILDAIAIDKCCKSILKSFDTICLSLIDDSDQKLGYIEIENRQNKKARFPFPSISLSAIDSRITQIKHIGEVSTITSEIKKIAKKKLGSNYLIHQA